VFSSLGELAIEEAQFETAREHLAESLTISAVLLNRWLIATVLRGFVRLSIRQRNFIRAVKLFGAAEAAKPIKAFHLTSVETDRHARDLALLRDSLGELDFNTTWQASRSMTLKVAIALALDQNGAS